MIEPTDEMKAAVKRRMGITDGAELDPWMEAAIGDLLAIAERQWQEQYGDAFQRGWWRGQHRFCPRCGVGLEREVAAERDLCRAPGPDGLACQRRPAHGENHAASDGNTLVQW